MGHINQLAKDRRLILIEARGQGEPTGHSYHAPTRESPLNGLRSSCVPPSPAGKTELSLETASIEQHVLDFER